MPVNTREIDKLLQIASEQKASDLHLLVGKPPILRIDGQLTELTEFSPLTPDDTQRLVFSILTKEQQQKFTLEREMDLSYGLEGISRYRVNIHWEKGNVGLVSRVVKSTVPTMEELALPEVVYQLTRIKQGLILMTGPTGCGKSTTLAAMINLINKERNAHIITLEDPIEYLFQSDKSYIRQRQYEKDFLSFADALKHVVRQDPNVIMVGEMRDLETIAAAITVAETGHLVLATLHTLNAAQTIDRIIDVFPPHQQEQVRLQLALELRGVISQQLIPKEGGGRVAAREIMINTPAVSNLIRENKVAQLKSVIQTSADEGMVSIDQDLKRLHQENIITKETAQAYMMNPKSLE
ncbi:MAG: type IV pilus twitching motility protein PilT [Patescibacteria group bacterium]